MQDSSSGAKSTSGPKLSSSRRIWIICVLAAAGIAVLVVWFALSTPRDEESVPVVISPKILREFTHDSAAFTQGLEFLPQSHYGSYVNNDSALLVYESVGLYGESDVRIVDLESSEVLHTVKNENTEFGEGLTLAGPERTQLYQLLWRLNKVIVYEHDETEKLQRIEKVFPLPTQGWGICYDEANDILYVTDGSDQLFHYDPYTFKEIRRVTVSRLSPSGRRVPQRKVNELEFIDGKVYANIWMKDIILVIDPSTGYTERVLDLSHLKPFGSAKSGNRDAVLNGIAFQPSSRRLFVTGKLWPKLYEIEFA